MDESDILVLTQIVLGLWLFINLDSIMEKFRIENNLINSMVFLSVVLMGTMLFLSIFTSKGIETFLEIM